MRRSFKIIMRGRRRRIEKLKPSQEDGVVSGVEDGAQNTVQDS
jgi:hypothetical protein